MKKLFLIFLVALLGFCSCDDCSNRYYPEYSYLKIGGTDAVGIKKYCFSPYCDSLVRKPIPIDHLKAFFTANPVRRKLTGPKMLEDYASRGERESDFYVRPYLLWFDADENIVCVWDLRKDSPDTAARWRNPEQWRVDTAEAISCKGHGDYVEEIYNNIFVFDSSDIMRQSTFNN